MFFDYIMLQRRLISIQRHFNTINREKEKIFFLKKTPIFESSQKILTFLFCFLSKARSFSFYFYLIHFERLLRRFFNFIKQEKNNKKTMNKQKILFVQPMCYAYTKRFRKRSIHNNIFHFYVIQYAYRSKTNINMYIMKSLHLYFWSFMLHSNIGFRAFCVYTMLGSDAINNIFQNWNTNKNYTFFVIFSLYHKYYI